MTISDGLMLVAVLLAPILAVQVQKALERYREDRARKLQVFKTLMATRAATLSPEHVQALNMIDLEFHGPKHRAVTVAWKEYLDHLAMFPKDDEKFQVVWADKRADLLTGLLMEMGKSLEYQFDAVQVKKGIYAPEGHAQIEDEQVLLRRGLIQLLYGNRSLKMDVQSFPVDEQALENQKLLTEGLISLLNEEKALRVSISDAKEVDEQGITAGSTRRR